MKPIFPILALGVVFAATGAAAKPMGHNIILSPPTVVTVTPTPVPTVNSGALGVLPQQTIGAPIANLAPTATNSMLQNFGALPGERDRPPTILTRHFRRSVTRALRLRRPPARLRLASTRRVSVPAPISIPGLAAKLVTLIEEPRADGS